MYPNDDQPINHADYLNQISSHVPQNKNILTGKPSILIVGIAAVILLIIIMGISSLFSGGIKPTEQLAARLLSTESTANSATANLKSSQMRELNTDLRSFLTNTIRDITPILTSEKINIKSLDKKVLTAESDADLLEVLNDARLNAVYENTYAREMAYRLDTILNLMLQINNNSSNRNLKTFLTNARTELEPLQKRFQDFDIATN